MRLERLANFLAVVSTIEREIRTRIHQVYWSLLRRAYEIIERK